MSFSTKEYRSDEAYDSTRHPPQEFGPTPDPASDSTQSLSNRRLSGLMQTFAVMLMLMSITGASWATNVENASAAGCTPRAYGGLQGSGVSTGYGTASCSTANSRTLQVCLRKHDPWYGRDDDIACSTHSAYAFSYRADVSKCSTGSVWIESRLDGTARSTRWNASC